MLKCNSSFKPAWWLPSAHAQTIYPSLFRRIQSPVNKWERIELPDGDFVDTAWVTEGLSSTSPLVILLHGLGGNIHSSYIGGLMQACKQKGWRTVLMHFRGASFEPNRFARAYHSGDTSDFDFFLKKIVQQEPSTKKAAIGISLGGNVLLKWLGENALSGNLLDAAVGVSVPFELRAVANKINEGFSRIYQRHLLKKLRLLFNQKIQSLQGEANLPIALKEFEKWDCFWTFDEQVTAPLHGFPGVHDYYKQSSCRQYLSSIITPTLIIHAKDDPFMNIEILPSKEQLSSQITFELSEKGGHVGFVSGDIPGRAEYWLDRRITDYLEGFL